jgi:hypothetical protein
MSLQQQLFVYTTWKNMKFSIRYGGITTIEIIIFDEIIKNGKLPYYMQSRPQKILYEF